MENCSWRPHHSWREKEGGGEREEREKEGEGGREGGREGREREGSKKERERKREKERRLKSNKKGTSLSHTWVLKVTFGDTFSLGSIKSKEKVGNIWSRLADAKGEQLKNAQLNLFVHHGNGCSGGKVSRYVGSFPLQMLHKTMNDGCSCFLREREKEK